MWQKFKISFQLIVLCFCVFYKAANARDNDADELAKMTIAGLYAFEPYKYIKGGADGETWIPEVYNNERIVLLLTVHPATERRSDADLFSSNAKYSIYVSNNSDLSVTFEINVFFGGGNQYAFYINNQSNPILGKIGEYTSLNDVKVFAGERDNPDKFDKVAFQNLVKTYCLPVKGFRCADAGNPENAYAKGNVAAIAVEMPIKRLTGLITSKEGKIKVWAKVYKGNG